jgi:Zn-dependent protease with chaperone function
MAMDFFERQDHARRQTFRLLVMFALSVAVIVLVVYLIAVVATSGAAGRHGRGPYAAEIQFWNPSLLLSVAVGTIVVISLGSLYKIAELASGGESVALMLGGRAVNPQTTDPAERRILNVVEEMALASGVPVPPVFVLDHEPSINAFAAGHQPGDAVVAVSRGCLEYLSREELQGVLGHEFSHILNGDMRLNLRLVGVVYGILVLSILGYYVMRSAGSFSSRDSDRKGDPGMAVFLIGLSLYILGYLGVFLGEIIKSAISRQREFLADASSVQFTRNPQGLAGALKKIGGLSSGSRIADAHAHEVSHMFFADAFAGSLFNLFATHPPLEERIRLLEPNFDGRYPDVAPVAADKQPAYSSRSATTTYSSRSARGLPYSSGSARGQADLVAPLASEVSVSSSDLSRSERNTGDPSRSERRTLSVGRPQNEHLELAGRMMADMPPVLVAAAREPFSARAVIWALLLSREDEPTRGRQLQMLQASIEPPAFQQTVQLFDAIRRLSAESRLPLADLTVAALKRISPQQYAQFRGVVEALTAADGRVDLFEYCLRVVLFGYLDVHFGLKPPVAVRYRSIGAVAQPLVTVLSALAYAGQSHPDDIQRAFQAGAGELLGQAAILPPQQCTFDTFDAALGVLAQASPQVKRAVVSAVVACISADGQITLEEGELLRAVAAALACPVPPTSNVTGPVK